MVFKCIRANSKNVNFKACFSVILSSSICTLMKVIKRIFFSILVLLALASLLLLLTGNQHVFNGITKTFLIGKSKPDVDDMGYFAVSNIKADHAEPWPFHAKYNKRDIPQELIGINDSMQTTAFLVIKNDSLLFEKYWMGCSEATLSNSFSMAKSFTSILVGKAIDEGYIKGLDQLVSDFIPEFKDEKNASLTIRHLLQMTSGIPFGESYNSPFGYMAKAYYGKNLIEETMKFKVEKDPGTFWVYEGGNSVLLGMIIQKATGRSCSDYFFQKIWSCIDAEHDAHWNLDHEGGMEKTFSGFYSTARDFARIGKLYENNGIWGNDTIVSPDFVRESLTPNGVVDEKNEPCIWYGLHWWLGSFEGERFFSCRGMRGQYIVVFPEEKLICVRLGHNQSKVRNNNMPEDLYKYIKIAKAISKP
jgi:CubicO group peptidase (beta-lactamase class C family)